MAALVIASVIAGVCHIIFLPFYKFLTSALIFLIFHKTICLRCFHYSIPLRSTYNNGTRHCEHCHFPIDRTSKLNKIIGLIGGEIENYKVDEDKLYVNLWSEDKKETTNADVDMLLIRNSPNISYDWAINAVIVTLKNDVSRPPDYLKKIPVVIEGKPPIPEESMSQLKQEFKEIKSKV